MALSYAQARKFYDRFGRKQDTQAFYEDRALQELIAHGEFEQAHAVFELGCGTGRFALRLLSDHLPADASYTGYDLSKTMVTLTQERLVPYAGRARVILAGGEIRLPLPDHSVDRVIATYVLDLLAETDIHLAISEAHRVLRPGGRLCLVSLTEGVNVLSRLICRAWSGLYKLRAEAVGGCRPVRLMPYLDSRHWHIAYHKVLTQFGVPSEIVIATPAGP